MRSNTGPDNWSPEPAALAGRLLHCLCEGPRILGLGLAVNAALISTAFAYIDPGTGTMILQVAGALFASALFYLRSIRLWISDKLGFRRSVEPVAETAEVESKAAEDAD